MGPNHKYRDKGGNQVTVYSIQSKTPVAEFSMKFFITLRPEQVHFFLSSRITNVQTMKTVSAL